MSATNQRESERLHLAESAALCEESNKLIEKSLKIIGEKILPKQNS